MKRILCFLYSFYFVCHAFIKKQNVHAKKSRLFNCKVKVDAGSSVIFEDSSCFRSKISIEGGGDAILCKGLLRNCDIKIVGKNNQLLINNVRIDKMNLVIRGNDCIVQIGEGTSIGSAHIVCMGKKNSIKIGQNCMIAENVDIWNTDSHPIYDQFNNIQNESKPVFIGNNVWLGKQVKVLKGVSIGNGAIVGMGSLVTKNITEKSLYAGNPAKQIKSNISWSKEFITE